MQITAQKINEEPYELFQNSDYDPNIMYIDQLKEFVCMVEEGRVKHKYDVLSAVESLKVVNALFESNTTGKKVSIYRGEKFSF